MKILKRLGLVILAIIAAILIVAIFIPIELTVERTVTINKPVNEVFDYVKSLRNQDNYAKWNTMDPNMQKTYTGTDGEVGFISAWKGNKDVGSGEQEITKIVPNELIATHMKFIEPWESEAEAYLKTKSTGVNQTEIIWGFDSKSPYPTNIMNLFMDKMLGKDYEFGLNKLKEILEAQPSPVDTSKQVD